MTLNQVVRHIGHVINLVKKFLWYCNKYEWYVSSKLDSFVNRYSFTLNRLILNNFTYSTNASVSNQIILINIMDVISVIIIGILKVM